MKARRLLTERVRFLPSTFSREQLCHQVHREGHVQIPSRFIGPHLRHMGIFREFAKLVKGEVEKNPELQKSIQVLREKAGDLNHRTKETTEKIYKHVGVVREEAGAKARQVSDLFKERVHGVKEKVSEASTQAKDSSSGAQWVEDAGPTKPLPEESAPNEGQGSEDGSGGAKEPPKKEAGSKVLFSKLVTRFQSAVSSSASSLLSKVKGTKFVDFAKQGYDLVKEELTSSPSRRKKATVSASPSAPRSSSTDVVLVVKKRSIWEKYWDDWKEKAESNKIYKRFKGVKKHPVVIKGQEIAEDMRERWETSDSPVVHKIQDLNESLFGETATAIALKEIRRRDPTFSFPDFLSEVQENARGVLQAYLKGDIKELQKRCTREVVDRCRAERRAYESQGLFFDNKILHVSDLELKETKLLGNVPIIIVTFQTQQIFCVRDKHGKITQGAKDDILTVYYAWAMQQVSTEEMEEDDFFPQWQLREMLQLGVQAII